MRARRREARTGRERPFRILSFRPRRISRRRTTLKACVRAPVFWDVAFLYSVTIAGRKGDMLATVCLPHV